MIPFVLASYQNAPYPLEVDVPEALSHADAAATTEAQSPEWLVATGEGGEGTGSARSGRTADQNARRS